MADRAAHSWLAVVARRRVALGFLLGALVLWLSQPTGASLLAGIAVIVEILSAGAPSSYGLAGALFAVIAAPIGVVLASAGLLGEYLWRAVDDSRGRPLYVVMDKVGLA